MTGIIELIVVAIASLVGGIFLALRGKGSGGTTSPAVKDQLDVLGEKIADKKKEAEEAIKRNDDLYEKNTEAIDAPVDSVSNTIDTANELWKRRNSR